MEPYFIEFGSSVQQFRMIRKICRALQNTEEITIIRPMFDPIDPKQSFPAMERGILRYWREEDTFKRSISLRTSRDGSHPGDPLNGVAGSDKEERFSFYDGPPFATGLPHYGHLLAGIIKDVIPRYQTMRGRHVERRFGWDCHGLPIENIIEREHGIRSRKDIEKMGVKAFNDLCRNSVQRYTKEWRMVVERIGRWVDMDWDYRTMDSDYMESIWWVFKSLFEKKLIYEGHKPMHVCPRCVTPLSNFEVTQGYKDIVDFSIAVKFELLDEQNTFALAWTTTPWTLPGNLFLAVNPEADYVKVKYDNNNYIVAEALLDTPLSFTQMAYERVGKSFKGKTLIGKKYVPLFPYFAEKYKNIAFKIVTGDFVTLKEGTGMVHIAPGFGEDDFEVGKREGIPLLQHVTMDGKFTADVKDFAGMDVKPIENPSKTDREIYRWLHKRKLVWGDYSNHKHSYPHCWRCDSPLLNYVTSSWFVAVEKIKEKMLSANSKTSWIPAHLRDGRFGKWLEGARDWAISRSRYWGTPLPIWRCPETGDIEVVGSRDELMSRMPVRFTKVTVLRHAESEGNVSPRYQGMAPGTDLTGRGRAQAAASAEFIAGCGPVARIYCSPLARAMQTAKPIASITGAEIVIDGRLREVEFGAFEGKSVDFSDLTFVKARRAHKLETGKVESIYHFPGMETWSQVQARVKSFADEVLPRHRGEHVIVVTHADPALNFKHFFTKEDPAKLCHQPYPSFASPESYFWDHDSETQLDLHKETADQISWPSNGTSGACVEATLVRHGQSEMNSMNILQGQEGDTPLTGLGREQARKIAGQLKRRRFDAIVTSDLKRAMETAEIISRELHLPIAEYSPLLRERKFGDWVGGDLDEVMAKHPLIVPSGEFGIHHESPPAGESLSQFVRRAREAQEHLLNTYPGKKLLIVTHGGMIQALALVAELLPYREALQKSPVNCEASTITLRPLLRRVPEVLDCWFESGAMPYAQGHHPFRRLSLPAAVGNGDTAIAIAVSGGGKPMGFPADFIAEGIDQTRGWFYTLTVLAAALFDSPAFMNCIVNGTVLAEDGKKMSKRLKNYPEPLDVVERHGADAVRFALMSSPAVRGEDLRFSERSVEEVVRSVLLPLWNTYSFFVTYANAAKWEAAASRRSSGHPLDRWIRAEVQDMVNRMSDQLDRYDLSATCAELHETIDALTNWYVRLSRRRFAGKAGLHATEEAMEEMNEQDRLDALATLYDVLLTLSQILAPFCPFVTEHIYLNLAYEEHGSIHLTDWPATRKLSASEEKLLRKTRLLRNIASLCMKIRSGKKIKLRQPLGKVTIAVPPALLGGDELTASDIEMLQEELNVHSVGIVNDPDTIADRYAMVDARKAGPRLGARVQEIIQAGKRGEFSIRDDGAVLILEEVLGPEEASVMYRGREGEDAAADKGIVVTLDARITAELALQGKAREIIRFIQKLRKEKGLSPADGILLQISGAEDVMKSHKETILHATGATLGEVSGEAHVIALEEKAVIVKLKKV